MIGIAKFRSDPRYLLKNNLVRITILLFVDAALFLTADPSRVRIFAYLVPIILLSTAGTLTTSIGLLLGLAVYVYQSGFEAIHLFYSLAALVATFPVTAVYHSCAHQSLRPLWLNRFVGELCGLLHTSNLDEWSIIHFYHHRHADDVANDPHPPEGQSFFRFASTTAKAIGQAFGRHYFQAHEKNTTNQKALKAMSMSILVRQHLLTLFWFLALGPAAFVYFFAVTVVFKKVHYAWFNWATHVKRGDEVHILNQNSGWYRLVNYISFNLYYHKNHHLKPSLFNPKRLGE